MTQSPSEIRRVPSAEVAECPVGRPVHDELSVWTRVWEVSCLILAVTLLTLDVARLAGPLVANPWWLLVSVAGFLAADLFSGLVHWTADTWGSETMPLLGRRFVRPFRVHHVNPDDFLRRSFIDCNGDVAMLVIPIAVLPLLLPLDASWGLAAATFLTAFGLAGLPTNQVHQWAHMPRPPRWVAWLQRRGLVLGRAAHARHHRPPHDGNYCIATGWCNRPLQAVQFFPRLEALVRWCTGLEPRADDAEFAAEHRPISPRTLPSQAPVRVAVPPSGPAPALSSEPVVEPDGASPRDAAIERGAANSTSSVAEIGT